MNSELRPPGSKALPEAHAAVEEKDETPRESYRGRMRGHGKIGYLRWERNLDEWFHFNNILRKERLAYAIDQLREEAFKWWVQEEDDRWFYNEILQVLKSKNYIQGGIQFMVPKKQEEVAQEGQRVLSQQDNFQPNQGHAIVHCLDQKSDIPNVRKMSTSVGQNTLIRSKDKPEQAIVQVKARSVITGLKEPRYIEEETPGTSLPTDQKEAQSTKQSKLLNKPKPVIIVSNQGIPDESHILTEPEHELNQNPHHKWKPKTEQKIVQVPKPEEAKVSTRQRKNKKFLLPQLI
ncbi:uncharacterized protein LOC106404384 [Brassica napus]|uniref:uncharacterized protein LOC106404384 n=1 Tax=Brassica napus TaxID=3708 RepID=UPI002079AF5C|nr:uncharacterized protein LOC106404384 [Brassica napus]